jgi:hypothetical protein
VDAKGKTVGRLLIQFQFPNSAYGTDIPTSSNVVRQISGIWVVLSVANFATGFETTDATNIQYWYQSIDCTGQAYFAVNPYFSTFVAGPTPGFVTAIPPATAPSIYFTGSPVFATMQSFRNAGSPCQVGNPAVSNPNYVGPVESVPLSSLGLTLPFSIK